MRKKDISYAGVMARRSKILKSSLGIDYGVYESGSIAFDYGALMAFGGYGFDDIRGIQKAVSAGNTPLIELRNITRLLRQLSPPGKGARVLLKDEACNPSGSSKERRAAITCHHAKRAGYKGVVAAAGNSYGMAVAAQAARQGLRCVVVQECYDSRMRCQPEAVEAARKCEALGAEVLQLSVGPEMFYVFLSILEETGFMNASLYSPFGVLGVETLGYEIARETNEKYGRNPDAVICAHAGGGNVTGTARGLIRAGAGSASVIAASVDLRGLDLTSDESYNLKSFTTGHTGSGMPFAADPDRSDTRRSAARPLRYMDRYVLVSQGEVFYATEVLVALEGLERGPAGNTGLAAAFSLAREMGQDEILVVQGTEYAGAGRHSQAQLSFARENGIVIKFGDPGKNIPGKNIIIPDTPERISAVEQDMGTLRKSLITNKTKGYPRDSITAGDIAFLAEETKTDEGFVEAVLNCG
ncbi:MAG: 2-amino-4-oxopentanoate thiolase subunit OrtB [Defluviitaleaceae bacterium]|nr:2-amino-4-oxopentanoate thiolase subunit OrtB [Defluviitaleaceae bacterium]MCL2836987.1 2-amino-4-oxopentanoate thiolase subunit OrtB [Defluviitaleaceae bacterium]